MHYIHFLQILKNDKCFFILLRTIFLVVSILRSSLSSQEPIDKTNISYYHVNNFHIETLADLHSVRKFIHQNEN